MAQKRFVDHCQKRMLEDRGALPKEEGDIQGHALRKLSQQLVGDGCRRQRRERDTVDREAKEEESKREFEGDKERVAVV